MTIYRARIVQQVFRSYRQYHFFRYSCQGCHFFRIKTNVLTQPLLQLAHNARPVREMSTVQAPVQTSKSSASAPVSTKNDLVELSIVGEHGQEHCSIRRSYPKGKPEKLMSGLQKLLSFQEPEAVSIQPSLGRLRWSLSTSGDAIHLAFTLSKPEHIDRLIQALKRESDALNHHPHTSYQDCHQPQCIVFVITCSTHVPHGLSLKDVKLANQVNDILGSIEEEAPGTVGQIDDAIRPLAASLIRQNEDKARSAREDSNSACNKAN